MTSVNSYTEYPKIKTVFKRDPVTHKIPDNDREYSLPEFEYLSRNDWMWTEKVDGCLHYVNMVTTDNGSIPIGRIVEKRLPVKVLSYNTDTGAVEYKPIAHYHREKRVRDFLSIEIKSRNKGNRPKHIVCTDNHKFFSCGKWVEAKDLVPGQKISHLSEHLSCEVQQIILGGLLGDSSINRPSATTRGISFSHSLRQHSYFDFKMNLLGNLAYVPVCMKYKLSLKYKDKDCACALENYFPSSTTSIADTEVISVSKDLPVNSRGQQEYQYDLSVADNSNYFTSSVLVHNTNIRIIWTPNTEGDTELVFRGRTDGAMLPPMLARRLEDLFLSEEMIEKFKRQFPDYSACLYGEGFGKGIQKGGENYIKDGCDFVLFDVKCGPWWLRQDDVRDIAECLQIGLVPWETTGTLLYAVDYVKQGFKSAWGDFISEGLVGRPKVELFARNGERIITKIKTKDF